MIYPQIKTKWKCQIGFQSISNYHKSNHNNWPCFYFIGVIGSVIVFSEIFSNQIIDSLYTLGTEYEMILFRNYECFSKSLSQTKKNVLKFLKQHDKYKFEQNLALLISSAVK